MNIHEYQAKELLEKFGVATPRGKVAARRRKRNRSRANSRTTESGREGAGACRRTREGDICQRFQRRRASGEIAGGSARGRLERCSARRWSRIRPGAAGRVVNKVLVAESVDIEREIYFAVLLDRATAAPMIVASTEGGVEIETVAEKSPEKIIA